MTFTGEYVPSTSKWVADQVAEYEASNGERANTLGDTGIPVIVVTMQGRSGVIRKIALMRVEHDGSYALIASMGGAPQNPVWYGNIVAHPRILIQDGPEPREYTVTEVTGDERDAWFDRGAVVYPPYLEYQENTDRTIPVLIATPA